ncbi:TVP38/TMEM64 family protein [Thiovibrio sp. JS02]
MTRFLKGRILSLALIAAGIAAMLLYAQQDDSLLHQLIPALKNSLNKGAELRAAILDQGILAPLVFIGLQILQVIIAPIPGEASGILGGYIFGALPGFVYSSLGLTLGSWLAFAVGRLLSDLIRRRLEQAKIYQQFNHLIAKGDFIIPFVLFLFPGFPKDSLSYLLGMSHMPLPVFLFITAVGRMPGTLMLSFQGAEVYQGNFLRLAVLLLVSALVAIPCAVYRKQILAWLNHYSRRTFADTSDQKKREDNE